MRVQVRNPLQVVALLGVIALGIANAYPGISVRAQEPGPTPTSPANGQKLDNLGPLLQWTQEAGTTWFEIRVVPFNNDGPGINLIIGDAGLVALGQYQVQEPSFGSAIPNYVMLPDLTYTWQVRTAMTAAPPGEGDWTEWSTPFTFETANKGSGTIRLENPASGATAQTRTPTLVWSNSDRTVFYYEIQISRDPGFCMTPGCPMLYWELRHGGLTVPLNSYTVPGAFPLEAGRTYYWRVRPRIQGDGTPVEWSPPAFFQTSADATAPTPTVTPTGSPPTATATRTPGTGTGTPAVTGTVTTTRTVTVSPSPGTTGTVTASPSPGVTGTVTVSPSPGTTGTVTVSPSPGTTGTVTVSPTAMP